MAYGFVSRQNVRSTVRGGELQPATSSYLGGVKIDGTTITINNGVISAGISIPLEASTGTGVLNPQDTLFIFGGTGVYTNAFVDTFTISIGQEVTTTSNVSFAGVSSNTITSNSLTTNSLTSNTLHANSAYANSLGVGTAASGTIGEIRAVNNVTAYYSDERLKTRLGNIENALDKVDALEGFYYEANATAQALGYKPRREVGVSAQAVQSVLPEIVTEAPIDAQYLTIYYERLTPLLIEAIKELRREVQDLKQALTLK
jgi:hypothetical protein